MLLQQIVDFSKISEARIIEETGIYRSMKIETSAAEQTVQVVKKNQSLSNLIFLAWFSCFAIMGVVYVYRLKKYKLLIKTADICVDERIQSILVKWIAIHRIRRSIKLVCGNQMVSPFTIGVIKPVIYLPKCFTLQNDLDTIEAVLAHETTHIKNGDDLCIRFQNIIQLVFFFNPVVWAAGKQLHQVREQFCDAIVISKRALTQKTYGHGLLNVIRMNLAAPDGILVLPNFTNQKERLIRRIQSIKQPSFQGRTHIWFSFIFLVLFGLFIFPMADESKSGDGDSFQKPAFISPYPGGFLVLELGQDWNAGTKEYYFHKGVDIWKDGKSATIVASDEGTVLSTGKDEIFTEFGEITIRHKNGFQTRYLHLDSIYVKSNQTVKKGQNIGRIPSCIHFEILKEGQIQDPELYLTFNKRLSRRVIKG